MRSRRPRAIVSGSTRFAASPFPCAAGTEYYTSDDYAALTEIDAVYFYVGSQRRPVYVTGNLEMDQLAEGSVSGGEPYRFSRYGTPCASIRSRPA
jgi:hypothetical protein